jgi:hypothetical protein
MGRQAVAGHILARWRKRQPQAAVGRLPPLPSARRLDACLCRPGLRLPVLSLFYSKRAYSYADINQQMSVNF